MWGDTVYTSKQEFNGYLKAKGLSYGAWLERNPGVAPWEPGGPHDQASPSPPQSIENWLSGFPLPPIVGLLAISAALLLLNRRIRSAASAAVGRAADPVLRPLGRNLSEDLSRTGSAISVRRVASGERLPQATGSPWLTAAKGPQRGLASTVERKPHADALSRLEPATSSQGMRDERPPSIAAAVSLEKAPQLSREKPQRALTRKSLTSSQTAEATQVETVIVRPSPDRAQQCEIRCEWGDKQSQFLAVTNRTQGSEEHALAASPSFRWEMREPPWATPAATAALRELVKSLEREGWAVVGRGEDWFAFRFRLGEAV